MSGSVSSRYKDALQRGHVAVVKGRPQEAIGHYQEAGRLASDRPLPWLRMGQVYLQMAEPRAAVQAFDEALRRAPSDIAATRGKAAALAADGRQDEARATNARAAELEAMERAGHGGRREADPRLAQIERHVANAGAARRTGDLGIAAAAYLAAANGFAALDDHDAALDACLHGLEAQPGNIDIHFVMTMLYLRRGWTELGVQRAMLIERRLDIDDDALRRNALAALARDFRTHAPELERLASTLG
jgi:tetratricopeptide (TPR) repeat protein